MRATNPKIDDRDWSALSTGQRIHMIEVEGYVVLPDLIEPDDLAALKAQTASWDTNPLDYSDKQRSRQKVQFEGGAVTKLIGNPKTLAFLREMFGDEILMTHYDYARSEPGHPGISLHTDGQPYGSEIFGFEGSCPHLVRVLYYLQDLTLDVSPFRVVPRSHLSMHAEANPYLRYEGHPGIVLVPVKAGGAVLINHKVFHGNSPNTGDYAREMLAIGYRPAWAGPQQDVEPWPDDQVAKLPDDLKPLFADRNTRHWVFEGGNKPANMQNDAPGIDPDRWERP